MQRFLLMTVLLAWPGVISRAADDEGFRFFESKIRPVLIQHCYECHSQGSTSPKGNLRLDSASSVLEGGDSGPAIAPGRPEESLLLDALRYESVEMPPAGKLPDDVIKDFETWIAMGAPDPRTDEGTPAVARTGEVDIEQGRRFWSFQPVETHVVPAVQGADWARNWIDHFVLKRLDDAGLTPGATADRSTLLRRIAYDLTGLPPAEEDIDRLRESADPESIASYVDALLESPRFGEHWGRHWLDVARYADSNGGDFNATFHEAWRYRNYIIDAYNQDRPFRELIIEQVAGDLLPYQGDEQRTRQLVATGFLMLGAKMLSERDKEKLRMDVVDEQVSVVGSAFLGMTLGCARCHDHKFDPVPTKDYYALAGIFRSTKTLDGEIQKYVSNWVRQPLPIKPEHAQALEKFAAEEKALKAALKQAEDNLKGIETSNSLAAELKRGTIVDDAQAEVVGQWKASTFSKEYIGAGYIHDDKMDKGQKRVTFRTMLPKDGEYEVRISYPGNTGRDVAVPVTVIHADGTQTLSVNQEKTAPIEKLLLPLGKFRFRADQAAEVAISNEGTTGYVIADAVQFIAADEAASPGGGAGDELKMRLADAKKEVERLKADLKALQQQAPPPAPVALAVNDEKSVGDSNICIRGEPRNLGPKVPRGFLSVASLPDTPEIGPDESGRLALAHWLADDRNPLTARVYVNRVWHYLMGVGLVRSVDNFGVLGERPTHPELLDQLAVEFMAHNWSTKWLVREIVLSHVYQLDSRHEEQRWSVDPENRLLWRANRKRLSAEAIRDTMLQASGTLESGGSESPVAELGTLVTENRADDTGYQQKSSGRRTLYEPVIRNELPSLMRVFDFADPDFVTGSRSETNVPSQALWMLNGPFVAAHAKTVAERLLSRSLSTDTERITHLFLMTVGRPPTEQESTQALAFLNQSGTAPESPQRQLEVWSDLAHAVFACSGFRMLD